MKTRKLLCETDLSKINIPELISDEGVCIVVPASANLDDMLTQPGRIEYVPPVGKKYYYQTDPADGQIYIHDNNFSDKLGECLVIITKPEAELSLAEQEYYKDRHNIDYTKKKYEVPNE